MRNTKPLPSIEYLSECFELPIDGILVWRKRPLHHFVNDIAQLAWNSKMPGKSVLTLDTRGYLQVSINGSGFRAHRIVYRMTKGEIPYGVEIDHENLNRTDNRPSNLRIASTSQNHMNINAQSNNVCGVKGVHFCKRNKRWIGQIRFKGHSYKGHFSKMEDAKTWVQNKRIELHGEFHNHG